MIYTIVTGLLQSRQLERRRDLALLCLALMALLCLAQKGTPYTSHHHHHHCRPEFGIFFSGQDDFLECLEMTSLRRIVEDSSSDS
jgi:hypothetical protein